MRLTKIGTNHDAGLSLQDIGKKMSKSLGNVMSPQKVVNNLGADILRLWIAGSDYTGEMTVSDEILKRSADSDNIQIKTT
jgi:isoleucyl-tRNA synthetase